MKNKFIDLNNHLFEALERVNDPDTKGEDLAMEIQRGQAIAGLARQIVGNASLVFKAKKLALEHGTTGEKAMPEFFDEKPKLAVIDGTKKQG
jgi:hypothetical protein